MTSLELGLILIRMLKAPCILEKTITFWSEQSFKRLLCRFLRVLLQRIWSLVLSISMKDILEVRI